MPRIRKPRLRSLVAGCLVFAILASGCSIVLTQGPPKPGESDYDATGAYPGGVPCTSSRMWPLVDLGLMLWVLALTVNYDNRDDQIDGSLTAAAAAISTWIGYRRTKACRDARAAAMASPSPLALRPRSGADDSTPTSSGFALISRSSPPRPL